MTTAGATRILVRAAAPYEVVVGDGVLTELPALLGPAVRRVAVLHARPVHAVAAEVEAALTARGLDVVLVELPDGEDAKRIEVAASCWSTLGRAGFTRSDTVVGIGGGAVTDLAGYVAAGWLRGVRVVHVPTTLLGMVDAAVGGKTGVNTAEGKNLVGAFHDPAGVLCDLGTLAGLAHPDLVSGLAEVVKCGFIADAAVLDLVEADPVAATDPASDLFRELVERSIRVKADVVAGDPLETDRTSIGREALNYGHTLGHAIERAEAYRWRHGEAVAVGLVFAAELGRLAGRLDGATADRHRAVLALVGLPTTYRSEAWPELLTTMGVDKKTRGDQLRFVVLDGLAKPGILAGPEHALLAAAYAAVAGPARP